jgi:V/A-type H+/Na+-transporting ATPase subunit C
MSAGNAANLPAKRTADKRYAFATGRIRALEAKLIGPARLTRYFETHNSEDFGRLLAEDGYPAAADAETSIDRAWIETCRLVNGLEPNPGIRDAILVASDFHNLKVMLKAFSVYWPRRDASTGRMASAYEQGEDGARPVESGASLTEGGALAEPGALWPSVHGPVTLEQIKPLLKIPSLVDPAKLFDALREQKPGNMPGYLAQTAATAARLYQQTYDIAEIDIAIDQSMVRWQNGIADSAESPFFREYLQLRVDLVNLGLALRTRQLNSGVDYLLHILLPGGTLTRAALAAFYSEPAAGLTALLGQTRLEPLIEAAGRFGEGGAAISRFSQAADNLLVQFIRRTRFTLRGPEVLIGYLVAREMETKTLRIILTCLRNRIPAGKARDMARLTG